MVVSEEIHNIMGGIESTGDVRLHNHRRKLKQRFDIVKKLGQGTYGKVQLGINKETGQEVAIKTIRKCKIETEADLIRIRREIQIMSSVRHPNIIHIYEVFENREKMVLVMEYAAGGELYDYLSERKVLSEDEARRIFRQIATAVYYCHKHNICHRDLKLENILLDEVGNAKIADFGLSNVFSFTSLLSTFCGSPLYASPEIVKGTPYVGPEVDCWSLGVLLYTLVYGAMPFDGSNFKRLVKQISQGDYFEPKNPSSASPLIADMLNVNPARRADIQAICSHWWTNETYSEVCLNVAEELARQTPVRLDLLLSLTTPSVHNVAGINQVGTSKDVLAKVEKPVRSQSLGNIPPLAVVLNVTPSKVPETKESVAANEDKKIKAKKKEHSHSKTRRKRSRSRSRKSSSQETGGDNVRLSKAKEKSDSEIAAPQAAPLVNSETQIISKPSSTFTEQVVPPPSHLPSPVEVAPESTKDTELGPKLVQRRKSKVFEVAEKFNASNEKHFKSAPSKKFENSLPAMTDETSSFEKVVVPDTNAPSEEAFPLTSTIALNKLVESAFRDEPEFDLKAPTLPIDEAEEGKGRVAPKLMSSNSVETNANKAATLPRRRTSRAEIQLVTPQFLPDNFKTEVEHFVNKPAINHKTEIVIPVSAPLPPKPLTKMDNQSKEHIIPIQVEQDTSHKKTATSSLWSASKSSIARTSSSSLSRQSTVESDSGSTVGTAEPIRKSPREVIIPIAVEGGRFVTPRADTLSRSTSINEDEPSKNDSRCFTLRSTKRRQPEPSPSAQLDTADSLSSDDDDNFQLLTAENLFSTLLSRVRSLTQRLNNDEMKRSSAFPRTLFAQHGSLFDNLPSRRLSETRSFNRTENAPWRRNMANNNPKRADSIRKRYSCINEENFPSILRSRADSDSQLRSSLASSSRQSVDTFIPSAGSTLSTTFNSRGPQASTSDSSFPSSLHETVLAQPASTKSEARQRLSNILAKHRRTSSNVSVEEPARLDNLKSMPPANATPEFVQRPVDTTSTSVAASPAVKEKAISGYADETSVKTKPPARKSRFLRPDFYDTPREESKYVIKNETVRGFRERSLSRQRGDLSRNRSQDSFPSVGVGTELLGTDYRRSKTCLPAVAAMTMTAAATSRLEPSYEYRRCGSEHRDTKSELISDSFCHTDNVAAAVATMAPSLTDVKSIRRRSMVLPCDLQSKCHNMNRIPIANGATSFTTSRASNRKSMLLQNELENEIRKTKNMNSKLNGLMVALSDTENHYTKNLARLSPSTRKLLEQPQVVEAVMASDELPAKVENEPNGDIVPDPDNYDKLSLLEKKFAYFRRLRSSDQQQQQQKGIDSNDVDLQHTEKSTVTDNGKGADTSTSAVSAASFENDTSSATSLLDEGDSDAWSVLSDGMDGPFQENVNDRIRRRSFYSRFNIYKQKSTGNTIRPTPKGSSIATSYSRSLSADCDNRQRSLSNSRLE